MENKTLELLLENANYTFAKTMPKNPHCYTLRAKWQKEEDFEAVVKYIRENGVAEKFFRSTYIYLYLNGYKYWTMGAPVSETILINRAAINL